MPRLFIALDLPEVNDTNTPIQFANMQLLIDQAIPNFRPSQKFHATLVFIGEVAETLIPTIKAVLERSVSAFINEQKDGLANGIHGLMIMQGAHLMGKNAIAMKLNEEYLLMTLVQELHKILHEQKIRHSDQEINLHVTLGRIPEENKNNIEIKKFLELLPAPMGARAQLEETFTAHTITLYQSLPNSEYIPLVRYKI